MPIPRTYSDKFIDGSNDMDLANKNVEWMNGPLPKVAYILIVAIGWGLVHISRMFTVADTFLAVNIIHGVISFIMFHWIKGSPDETSQMEHSGLTLYEQIDAGIPWTWNKKFLMLMPTVLTFLAIHFAEYEPISIIVNLGLFFILVIGKIPQLHRVRIFGINSTPGIDNRTEYVPKKRK